MTDDHIDKLKQEALEVSTKIDAAYEKLAVKLRGKADRAKSALDGKKNAAKRAVLQRRFELYADAAHDIETRLADRRGREAGSSD